MRCSWDISAGLPGMPCNCDLSERYSHTNRSTSWGAQCQGEFYYAGVATQNWSSSSFIWNGSWDCSRGDRDRLGVGLVGVTLRLSCSEIVELAGPFSLTVISSVGSDLKSFDLKSWFQITTGIFWFRFKITWKWWSVILFLNHFLTDFEFYLMFWEENHFTEHFICNSKFTSMPDFSQTFRLLLVNHSFMLVQIVPEWKHWMTLMTEKRACRSFLAIPMFVQRFWSTILLCRARHQSSAFSALEG